MSERRMRYISQLNVRDWLGNYIRHMNIQFPKDMKNNDGDKRGLRS